MQHASTCLVHTLVNVQLALRAAIVLQVLTIAMSTDAWTMAFVRMSGAVTHAHARPGLLAFNVKSMWTNAVRIRVLARQHVLKTSPTVTHAIARLDLEAQTVSFSLTPVWQTNVATVELVSTTRLIAIHFDLYANVHPDIPVHTVIQTIRHAPLWISVWMVARVSIQRRPHSPASAL
jgi:hypothetical protein